MWVWQQNGEIIQLRLEKISGFRVVQAKSGWHLVVGEKDGETPLAKYESKEDADAALEKVAEALRGNSPLIDLRGSPDRRAGIRR